MRDHHTGVSRRVGVPVETCTDRASHAASRRRRTLDVVDNRTEVREFLVSRRAKITPEQAGLPGRRNRRVPGLRRSEVAALAGVSVEYYAKLERGAIGGVSAQVLDAIARALQLDDAERAHLFDLAHAADGTSAGMRPRRRPLEPLDAATQPAVGARRRHRRPAFVRNGRMDLLAANHLGRALHADVYDRPAPAAELRPVHVPRPAPPSASTPTGTPPPTSASPSCAPKPAATPTTRTSTTWSASSPPAATTSAPAGARHDVRHHGAGTKRFHHPVVGDLTLAYEGLDMVSEPGLTLTIYAAEPASPSAERLQLLASWAATPGNDPAAPVPTATAELTSKDV